MPPGRSVCWLLAIAWSHALAVAPYPWEAVGARAWLQPSVDWVVLLSALGIAVQAFGVRRWLTHAATGLLLLVPVYRFGVTLMPVYYEKPFEPWVDLYELPGLVHLLTHDRPWIVQAGGWVGAVVAAVVLYGLTLAAVRCLARLFERQRLALGGLLVAQAAVLGGVLVRAVPDLPRPWRPSMAAAVLDGAAQLVRTEGWRYRERFALDVQQAQQVLASTPADASGLAGADVYAVFIESYGRAVLDGTARPQWEQWLQELAGELRPHGYDAVSAWLAPSVRGGGSSFAHGEFLTGVPVPDRRVFDLLLASDVRALPAILRDLGYHTVDVQPAMPRAWPEAKMFGFVEDMFQPAFPYQGRDYHWGRMPDQYALQYVWAEVIAKATKPLFVHYVSVTSHAPFNLIPPYYDDWDRALEPAAFAGEPQATFPITWANYANHPELESAYLASIRYSLRTIGGLLRRLQRPTVAFVLGDHQPPVPSSVTPQHMFDVPVHVLANRPELLAPWLGLGFRAGIVPGQDQSGFAGWQFLQRFLRAYGGRG